MIDSLREQSLSLMEGRGAILDLARELSSHIRESGLSAAVIGGIAVVLHGHWRATRDIDLQVGSSLQFARELDKSLRPAFGKLVKAIESERG